ncbi:hypothetical protein IAU59_005348 [Kwoniella sp. CBS 9459]
MSTNASQTNQSSYSSAQGGQSVVSQSQGCSSWTGSSTAAAAATASTSSGAGGPGSCYDTSSWNLHRPIDLDDPEKGHGDPMNHPEYEQSHYATYHTDGGGSGQ